MLFLSPKVYCLCRSLNAGFLTLRNTIAFYNCSYNQSFTSTRSSASSPDQLLHLLPNQSNPERYGAPPPPPPSPVSRKPREDTAKAIYDFAGEQPGDLSFKTGDIITIVEKSDSQEYWWTGRIGTRQGAVSITDVEYDEKDV